MTPNNFTGHPHTSLSTYAAEVVARNIMVILWRTGNVWRPLEWAEYKAERLKDGGFTEAEKPPFEAVKGFCLTAEKAKSFSPAWRK